MTIKLHTSPMLKLGFLLLIVPLLVSMRVQGQEQSISTQQLGQLSVSLSAVQLVDSYQGAALSGEVTSESGAAYSITSPMNVQRVMFLKPRGSIVQAGDVIVKLIGSEVEHYYDEYQLKKALFQQTSKSYENNRKLYEQKAIGEQQWLSISEHYVNQKLALGEYHHFFEYVAKYDHDEQSLSLKSPLNGMLNYSRFSSLNANQDIVHILPQYAVRLKVNLPASQAQIPSALSLPLCTLKIEINEGLSQSFYKTLWSEPLKANCGLRYGDILSVKPEYALKAYRITKTSVFSLHGNHYIMLKQADGFASAQVSIVASEQNSFIVTSTRDIAGAAAASSSVSALQGILMGLGE
ncbi:hypothetical protein [Glaciecola sp. SC05]|uniref:hypothetical protein n=1 Tax=Glaciecola sp. SC05 TaxID=1987355 RepID=UPI0035271883